MSSSNRKFPFQSRIKGGISLEHRPTANSDSNPTPRHIKLKMIIPALVILIIATAAGLYVSLRQLEQQQLKERVNWTEKIHNDFRNLILDETKHLNFQLDSLLQNKELLRIFKDRDREQLITLGEPYYRRFQKTFGTHSLDWILPDGDRFFSFQSPESTSGTFKTQLFKAAQSSGIQQTGIDTGILKIISLRTIRPIRIGGQHIGYVQIGKPLEKLTSNLQARTDIHLITVSASAASVLHDGYTSKCPVDQIPTNTLIASTMDNVPAEWIPSLQENGPNGTPESPLILQHNNQTWYGVSIPIYSVEGIPNSFLWILENEQVLELAKKQVFWPILGIAGTTSLLLFCILWCYACKIENTIQNQHALREQALQAEEKSRQALVESEDRFRTLFNEMEQGALIQNTSMKVQLANPAACRILNIPMDVMIGGIGHHNQWTLVDENCNILGPHEYPQSIAQLKGQPVRKVVVGLLHPGKDKYIWMQASSFPHRNVLGEITQTFTTFTDITDIKESEQNLRNERQILEEIFEASKIGYWDVDLASDTEYYSTTFKSMLGYAPDELVGIRETWKKLIYPEDLHKLNEALHEHITSKGKSPLYLELRYRHKKGHLVWVISAGKAIRWDEEGRVQRVVGCHIDISESKRVEEEKNRVQEQLANMQKLESIGRLAGGVAHDSNNLLQLILGHAEMALSESSSRELCIFHIRGIQDAAQRSAKLIQQLLAFARKQIILPRILHLNTVIEENLSILHQLLGPQIELDWEPDAELGRVLADPTQISQILTNLCTNARDAITGKGKVIIQTSNIFLNKPPIDKIRDFKPGMYVKLSVTDNGKGIPAEIIDRIFEPFFSTKQTGQGTGLGLSTVYGIVKQNQGVIEAVSPEGEGSTFHIYLPSFQAENEESHVSPTLLSPVLPRNDSSDKQCILLIDDEYDILRMASAILEQEGYKVIATSMVSEAISVFERDPDRFCLLISDVVMPEINGNRLLNHLRKLRPDLPWLLMSGYPLDVVTPAKEDFHFLHKPFSSKELLDRVAFLLKESKTDSDPA